MEMLITFPGGKRVDANFGDMVIHTDQHTQAGGEGSAPEPYATFLASIGTCAGIYVLSFCQNRGIDTEGLALVQTNEFDAETHRLTHIHLDIQAPPGFPEKYLEALRRVADKCAVKRTLFEPPEMTIASRIMGQETVAIA